MKRGGGGRSYVGVGRRDFIKQGSEGVDRSFISREEAMIKRGKGGRGGGTILRVGSVRYSSFTASQNGKYRIRMI